MTTCFLIGREGKSLANRSERNVPSLKLLGNEPDGLIGPCSFLL
jgi:hypothetical protein